MMKILHYVLFFFVLGVLIQSCSTPVSSLGYLYNVPSDLTYKNGPVPSEYRIRKNDNLYIKVVGEDELVTAYLNITGSMNMNMGSGMNNVNMDFITYIVNSEGTITMPQLGRINVEGKTVTEIEDILNPLVTEQVANTSVIVRVVNRTISVLGEVNAPGAYQMLKNNQTIFESLAMAGDLTDFGNRKNIKLVRETENGKYIAQLDLTDPSLIASPYYYILPSDVIYVEPRDNVFGKKTMPYGGQFTTFISIISSAITLAAALIIIQ